MPSVLIIDPNRQLASGLEGYLSSLGFAVHQAHRGDDGLALALKYLPDLILLDGHMPDKTGLQMCTEFRRHPETQNIPIILMSGLASFANQQQFARERGATEYISKPLKIIELGEMVNKYIGPKLEPGSPAPQAPPTPAGFDVPPDFKKFLSDRLRESIRLNHNK